MVLDRRAVHETPQELGEVLAGLAHVEPDAGAGEDFTQFLWSFVDGAPIQNHWASIGEIPAQSAEAVAMAKALKAKGFKFCGPVIVYAFMQAVGMVNDHVVTCFRHDAVRRMVG